LHGGVGHGRHDVGVAGDDGGGVLPCTVWFCVVTLPPLIWSWPDSVF
jgi:hypothetical protein